MTAGTFHDTGAGRRDPRIMREQELTTTQRNWIVDALNRDANRIELDAKRARNGHAELDASRVRARNLRQLAEWIEGDR